MSRRVYECKCQVVVGDDDDQYVTPTLDALIEWLEAAIVLDFDYEDNPYGVGSVALNWANLRDVTDDPSCKELPFDVKLDNHADP